MEKLSLFCCLFISCVLAVLGAPTPSETFQRSAVLESPDGYVVYWSYNDTGITFEVHVKTTGFVGFGLSPNGGMAASDIVVGGVKDGVAYLEDRYASGKTTPELDGQQDWMLLSGRQEAGYTVLKFTRLLKTCDSKDRAITTDTARLIWAYSSSTTLTYHGTTTRGTKSVNLLSPELGFNQAIPNDATYFDLLMENATIPAKDTEYHCRLLRVPTNITTKHHIIKMDPLIQAGNEKLVHHIVVMACHTTINDTHHGTQYTCSEWEANPASNCQSLVAAWAIGGPSYWYPNDAGLPIGDGVITYIVMQMHYDNPALRSDLVDSSGMRFWITPTLRKYDAGILEAGAMPTASQLIPPGQNAFTQHGWCSKDCFNQVSSTHPDGIHIFSVVLHTHLLGTAVRLRHIRNGIELPPIASDESYDFDFQTFQPVTPTVNVLPTDDLLIECVYKSTGRTNLTIGGEATTQEMCMVFAVYYPRMPFSLCLSTVTEDTLRGSLSYVANKNFDFDDFSPSQYSSQSTSELVVAMDWTQLSNVEFFQNNINKGSVYNYCQYSYTAGTMPTIIAPYTAVDTCTSGTSAPYTISAFITSLLSCLLAAVIMM